MFNREVILKSQQRFKNDHHKRHTEEVYKIALHINDDKRLQIFDGTENNQTLIKYICMLKIRLKQNINI